SQASPTSTHHLTNLYIGLLLSRGFGRGAPGCYILTDAPQPDHGAGRPDRWLGSGKYPALLTVRALDPVFVLEGSQGRHGRPHGLVNPLPVIGMDTAPMDLTTAPEVAA